VPAPAAPAPAAAASPAPAPAPVAVPGLGPGQLEAFHRQWVDAHVKAGGAAPRTSVAQLAEQLRQQLPRILAGKGASRVDLEAVVDAGKVRLRVRPLK
jgi:hypothetical protein